MRILVVIGAAALLSGTALAAETNPLHKEPGGTGVNPLHEGKPDAHQAPKGVEREPKKSPVRAERGGMSNTQSNPLYEESGQSGTNHKGY